MEGLLQQLLCQNIKKKDKREDSEEVKYSTKTEIIEVFRDQLYFYDIPANLRRKKIEIRVSADIEYIMSGGTTIYLSFNRRPQTSYEANKPLYDAYHIKELIAGTSKKTDTLIFVDEENEYQKCFKGSIHVTLHHHCNNMQGWFWISYCEKELIS